MTNALKIKQQLLESLLQVEFLTDREKDMLQMRLGLGGYPCATLQKIGDKYGITRERVRQIGNSIVRRIKKHMPDQTQIASKLFTKSWEPKYMAKKKQIAVRKAVIRRNRSLIRKKYQKLVEQIIEFSRTGQGKETIDGLFKELRLKYRRNKSLFEVYLVDELKRWRQRYMEVKRKGIVLSPETKDVAREEAQKIEDTQELQEPDISGEAVE